MNQKTFQGLVTEYYQAVYARALRLLHKREDAEEATQDAFMKAFSSRDKFRGEGEFATWMYRIVTNVCMDRMRKQDREEISLDEHDIADLIADNEQDIDKMWEQTDFREYIGDLLSKLPAQESLAFQAFYIDGRTYEEIASAMRIPIGTVGSLISRGRYHVIVLHKKRLNGVNK